MRHVAGDLVVAEAGLALVGGESEVDLGVVGVGLAGLHRPVGMVDGQDPEAGVVHRPPDRRGRRGETAGLTERDAVVDEGVGGGAQPLPLAHGGNRIGVAEPSSEAIQRVDRGGTADPVDAEAGVALELLDGADGVGSEDAVDPPGVEAQPTEPALQLGDVLAAGHGGLQVQQAVAQLVALLDERTPGEGTADAVGVESVVGLERDDGALRPVGEGAVVGSGIETGSPQPRLQVAYVIASGTEAEGADYRNSPSSWSSCPLPLAPTMRFAISPSLKTMSVGMLMTW